GADTYRLNGETALYYVRLRKIDTDRQRTQRQRNVLTSIANQIQSMGFMEMNSLLNKILPLITTNLSKTQIVSQLANVSSYLSNGIEQDVLPNKIVPLTLRDGYEVAIVDWDYEVEYAHKLFYSGVTPKYKEG
ncbi:MAG: LCP family protein, partial [Acutalibacteraceae bacterium]